MKTPFPKLSFIAYTREKEFFVLAIYNTLLFLSWVLVLPAAAVRLLAKKDTVGSLLGRFALTRRTKPKRRVIWLHAASVGELNTLETVLPSVIEAFQNHDMLVSVSNIVALEQARNLTAPNIHIVVAPLDYRFVIKKFLRHWTPDAVITIENELFPNRTIISKNMGLKVIWLNARISQKSADFWNKYPAFSNKVIDKIDHIFAQEPSTFDRFKALGVADDRLELIQNLKKFRPAPKVDARAVQQITSVFPYAKTLCAASTHSGEDALVLDAFEQALALDPNLKLILVPRHPKRKQDIQKLLTGRGLKFSTRSFDVLPTPDDTVFLADTMRELPLWYSASAVTFVAGSLLPIGGHTPFEPNAHGSAIIHGPHVSNFQEVYAKLDADKGAIKVETASELTTAWLALRQERTRVKTVEKAKQILCSGSNKATEMNAIMAQLQAILNR